MDILLWTAWEIMLFPFCFSGYIKALKKLIHGLIFAEKKIWISDKYAPLDKLNHDFSLFVNSAETILIDWPFLWNDYLLKPLSWSENFAQCQADRKCG